MFEIDTRGRFKRNGWASGRIGAPVSDLLPAEEELVELWQGLLDMARGVQDGLFIVTGAVQSPDPPLASALARFTVPRGSTDSAKEMSFNLIGLEKHLRNIHPDIHLEQASENGVLLPEFGMLVRVSGSDQFPAVTAVMEEIANAVQETGLGEFVVDANA